MIYLFIHQNFPGQYKNIVRYLADQPGNTVYFISQNNTNWMKGVNKLVYTPDPNPSLNCHLYTGEFDAAIRTGLAVARVCESLRQLDIKPDFIAGHSGWGETLFIKDIFPDTPLLSYFEFFYHFSHVDVNFDPEFQSAREDAFRIRVKNAVNLLSFDAADWGNAPTEWQKSLYPPELRARISAIHEGVDTEVAKPSDDAWIQLARDDIKLTKKDEVVTYVARNLEPYRGFHIFMRAAKEILTRRPNAHIVLAGGDDVSYGPPSATGETYRKLMMKEVGEGLPLERLHFLGRVSYDTYLSLLQISSAHVYLTYPFVLSWSFIEAMASGCALIGSDTPPVMEVLKDGENGLAVDFFSPIEIADAVDRVLDHPDRMQSMREAARQTAVSRFDFKTAILPRWLGLMDDLINGRRPGSTSVSVKPAPAPQPALIQRAPKRRSGRS